MSSFVRAASACYVTWLLFVVNLGVYLTQLTAGVAWLDPSPEALLDWGGNLAAMSLTGDWWRLLTNIAVHAGALHLVTNAYMLLAVGPSSERKFGRGGMFVIYWVGGLVASFASAWWHMQTMSTVAPTMTPFGIVNATRIELIVSVGASGAIMALCGALVGALWFHTSPAQHEEQNFGKQLLQVVAINIAMGVFMPAVDQAAHVGGLVAGFVFGTVGGALHQHARPAKHHLRIGVTALVLGLLVAAGLRDHTSKQLQDIRAQLTEEKRIRQRNAAKERLHQATADERRRLSQPVAEDEARGRRMGFAGSATATALSADRRLGYAVDYYSNQLTVLDIPAGRVIRKITGPQRAPTTGCSGNRYCEAHGAAGIAILAGQNLALVTSMERDALSVVDLTTGKIVRTLPLGQFPRAIIVSRDQQRAYVHNTLSNTVSVIDLAQWKVVKTLVLDGQGRTLSEDSPVPLWFSGDGHRLFVLNEPARQVEIYDTSSLAHLKSAIPQTVFQRAAPYAGADKTALALAKDRLLLVDEESLQHRRAWAFCNAIDGGELAGVRDAQGRNLAAVSHRNDTTVYIVNVDSGATIGTYPTASGVVHLEFSPDGKTLYALGENGVLSLIDRDKRMASEVDLICAPDSH